MNFFLVLLKLVRSSGILDSSVQVDLLFGFGLFFSGQTMLEVKEFWKGSRNGVRSFWFDGHTEKNLGLFIVGFDPCS